MLDFGRGTLKYVDKLGILSQNMRNVWISKTEITN
jgi:hypothetical protein